LSRRTITMTLLTLLGLVALTGICLKAVSTHAWRIDLVNCDPGRKGVLQPLVVVDRDVKTATIRAREYGTNAGEAVCAVTVEYLGRRPWRRFSVKPLQSNNP
jgi:hypothetical protein